MNVLYEYPSPVLSDLFKVDLIEIACGQDHNLAIDSNGSMYGWGSNKYGQLGSGKSEKRKTIKTPQLLPVFCNYKAVHIALGQNHSLILTEDGNVWSMGWNTGG